MLQTLLTVLIPYAAYMAAEAMHVSGILAVVAAGLWASGQEIQGLTADGRRHQREIWRMLAYVFNGLVFVLLGLQLREMLAGVSDYDPFDLALYALALWVAADGAADRLGVGVGARALSPAVGLGRRAHRPRPEADVPGELGRGAGVDHAGHRAVGAGVHQPPERRSRSATSSSSWPLRPSSSPSR